MKKQLQKFLFFLLSLILFFSIIVLYVRDKDIDETILVDITTKLELENSAESEIFSVDFWNRYYKAKKKYQLSQESDYNRLLAADAFNRAVLTQRRWLTRIVQPTGLMPRNEKQKWYKWLGRDNGADLLPYLLISSYFFDRNNYQTWLKVLDRQTELCGGLSCWLDLTTGTPDNHDPEEIIFDTAELLKDGFMTLLEWIGHEPYLSRSITMADKLMPLCQRRTDHGILCARRSEVNGDMMMVLSHLWLITDNDRYREFVHSLATAYVYDIFPRYGGLFPEKLPEELGSTNEYRLVMGDHSNEVIQGFADYCYALHQKNHPDYKWCLKEFNSLLKFSLKAPRGPEGLWLRKSYIPKRETDSDLRSDVWGYLVNTFRLYDYLVKAPVYQAEIKRIIDGAFSLRDYPWENNFYDGAADTIESMIYSIPYEQDPKYEQWIDSEIQKMFTKQNKDGKLDGGYLEGNFIRTAMLYGLLKSKGTKLENWRTDLSIGAASSKDNRKLFISASARLPWQGMLRFDNNRYFENMKLQNNYPRINTTPEWFVIKPEKKYNLVINGKNQGVKSGLDLLKGIDIRIQ